MKLGSQQTFIWEPWRALFHRLPVSIREIQVARLQKFEETPIQDKLQRTPMNLHPALISEEIKHYPFFASFDESLLLQVSTMVRVVDFPAGHVVLDIEQMHDKLYFLREGILEILVD
ncbi:MAG: hypothetical protein ACXWC9_04470, partial [Pseudobdellovibrionaceae bacterium]